MLSQNCPASGELLLIRDGRPGWNRTSNPQLRRLMLYPIELRAHKRPHRWHGRLANSLSQIRAPMGQNFLVAAPAFMRGKEHFSAPGESPSYDRAL